MLKPAIPNDEAFRIKDLKDLKILDTEPEERFDRIIRTVKHIFQVPIVMISLVDTNRQWFKAYCGISVSETPREISFCGHAINSDDVMIIKDATRDVRFSNNPLVVSDPYVRFYAGMPLVSLKGHKIGTLCLSDHKPREFGQEEIKILKDLAKWAELEINSYILIDAFKTSKEQFDKLEQINSVMMGREMKMVQLKEEIAQLKDALAKNAS